MTEWTAKELCDNVQKVLDDYQASVENPEPDPIKGVYAGDDLQSALDGGGIIQIMDAGATFERQRFVVSQSNTELRGNNVTLRSQGGPALWIPPGVHNFRGFDINGLTNNFRSVFLLGENGPTQTTLEDVPHNIRMERCKIPSHRVTAGFEVNAADVQLINCGAVDVWNTIIADSKALSILNTPGNVYVEGGDWSAASESVMIGGDSMKLPAGTVPTNITFKNMHVFKDLTWRTDGIRRGVKNLLELKSGKNVLIDNCLLENTWTDATPSVAFVFTPRNGLNVQNVTVDRCTVRNVGQAFNIMASNDTAPHNDTPIDQVLVKNSTFIIDHRLWGGRGAYALLNNNQWGAVGIFDTDNCYISGSAGYYNLCPLQAGYTTDTSIDPPVKTPVLTERYRLTRSRIYVPFYNNAAVWFQAGSAPLAHVASTIEVVDNVIGAGSTTMKSRYPTNSYITDAEFKALPQAPPNEV